MELKHIIANLIYSLTALLIVPYGIETSKNRLTCMNVVLLIVPYGIETYSSGTCTT